MKREFSGIFRLFSTAFAVATATAVAIVQMIVIPIFNLFSEAFPKESPALVRTLFAAVMDAVELVSQTGAGVWAFITDLFSVEGREYTWQAGDSLS